MDTNLAICALLGLVIGGAMGLTGAGGGVLAVPALVEVMGWPMQQAAPVALVAVAGAAAVGALQGLRHRLVRHRAAFLMAAVSVPFSALGVALAHRLPQSALAGAFAVVVVLTAVRVLRLPNAAPSADDALHIELPVRRACNLHPVTGRFVWNWPTALRLGAMGAAAGAVSGLLGVSGGFLIVPMLRSYTPLPMQAVVATTLLVTALIGFGSVLNAFAHGAHIPVGLTVVFATGAVMGLLAGRRIGRRLPQRYVQRSFAALLLLVAAQLVWKALA